MQRRRPAILVLLLLAALVAACDSTPGDPLDPRADIGSLLHGGPATGQLAGLSLPGLVYSAVHKVYSEHGASAARALVADLRRLEESGRTARHAGDREAAAARLRAIQDEELRIVLRVFGEPIVPRVIDAIVVDARQVERLVADTETSGSALRRARELLVQLDAQLSEAVAAAEQRNAFAALDAATRAAASAAAVRHVVAGANRIAGLDELFEDAASRVRAGMGADAARAELATFNGLRRAADEEVRNGDRDAAYDALKAVRNEQIRVVLTVLGHDAVRPMLDQAGAGIAQIDIAIAQATAAGRDVGRLERMSAAARDLVQRATSALETGDTAAALDLGSHAAGLVNAARHALNF